MSTETAEQTERLSKACLALAKLVYDVPELRVKTMRYDVRAGVVWAACVYARGESVRVDGAPTELGALVLLSKRITVDAEKNITSLTDAVRTVREASTIAPTVGPHRADRSAVERYRAACAALAGALGVPAPTAHQSGSLWFLAGECPDGRDDPGFLSFGDEEGVWRLAAQKLRAEVRCRHERMAAALLTAESPSSSDTSGAAGVIPRT